MPGVKVCSDRDDIVACMEYMPHLRTAWINNRCLYHLISARDFQNTFRVKFGSSYRVITTIWSYQVDSICAIHYFSPTNKAEKMISVIVL